MGTTVRAIGLMSGTSMDGIDVALVDTDGEHVVKRGASSTVAYDATFRAALRDAIRKVRDAAGRKHLDGIERELTERHAGVVHRFLHQHQLRPADIGVVGFHGHTVLHEPQDRRTLQLGDGRLLARKIGIDVVFDLRAADVEAGGEGAPMAPVYHRALAAKLPERPVVFLNIGGVANLTWIGPAGELLAFDTGPGNAMIDDWMQRRLGVPSDTDGTLAAAGRVHEDLVTQYLRHSYFGRPPPKSLDRNAFALELIDSLSDADGAATLAAFTVASIARAREHFPEQPRLWIVCGGGRRNKTLMSMLAGLVDTAVAPAEAIGAGGDSVEAEAWAYLAVRSRKGLPVSFPGTTGVTKPISGGVFCPADPTAHNSSAGP